MMTKEVVSGGNEKMSDEDLHAALKSFHANRAKGNRRARMAFHFSFLGAWLSLDCAHAPHPTPHRPGSSLRR
ncbi:MAG TPA: hypothetical protein PKX00_00855, partial [Opitutaceae bacterium]|nr:hypothetical protein [Opitutaceae bacterium]